MKKFWRSLSKGKQIAFSVVALHLFFLCLLFIHHAASFQTSPKKSIAVRTVPFALKPTLTPQAKEKTVASIKPPPPAPKAVKSPKAAPSSPKKTAEPKQVASKKPALPPPSIFEEIAKGLERIESEPTKEKTSEELTVPKALLIEKQKGPALQESRFLDTSYQEILASFLKSALELPEKGEVKLLLELRQDGSVKNLEILEAKSKKNGEFLKKRLPELLFPCLNSEASERDSLQFTLVFRSGD